MTTAAYATIPEQRELADSPVSNTVIADLETTRVIFFAMDAVTEAEKYELPFKQFGGIFLPQIKTLRPTKGMLYRCQLTTLKHKMIGEWNTMLSPDARKTWEKSFTQTIVNNEGQPENRTITGFIGSDPEASKEGEFKQKHSNHIVFKKRYPGTDVKRAVQRSIPHGVGGVVEITALKGAPEAEKREVQLFFFPEWNKIQGGVEQLPETVREMEAHLKSRIEVVKKSDWDDAQKAKYFSIGRDMLRSCEEFKRHALTNIKLDEIIVKDSSTKGNTGASHSPASELQLKQTESRRKDDLISGESSAVDRLARTMEEDSAAKSVSESKTFLLEERKQYLAEVQAQIRERDTDEEIRLGIRKPYETRTYESEQPFEASTVVETEAPVISNQIEVLERECGAPTANGTCTRILRENELACFQHKEKSK